MTESPPSSTLEPSSIESYYDAIILGAGTAGIAAARTLKELGYNHILIVEARGRMGGRVHHDPVYQDLGAAWSHINDPRLRKDSAYREKLDAVRHNFVAEAGRRGYDIQRDDQDTYIYWDGKQIPRAQYFSYLNTAFEELNEIYKAHGDMPMAEAFAKMKKHDAFMEWLLHMEFGWGSSGRDYKEVSLEASLKHLSCASGLLYREGLGHFIQDLGDAVAPQTALNTRVTGIYSHGGHTPHPVVEIEAADGTKKTISAKCVLSTIPPSVMMHKGAHAIEHDLPEWKTKALAALPSGAMNKIILELDPDYFDKKGIDYHRHYEVLDSKLGNMFFLARPAGHPVMVGFVGGEQSISLEKQSDEKARDYALKYLSSVPEFADIKDHIRSVHFTRWHQDPYSRGAYSTPVVGAGDAREKAFEPVDDTVFFAGEACAHGGWETHVYGAYETGVHAAELMVERVLSKKPHADRAGKGALPTASVDVSGRKFG